MCKEKKIELNTQTCTHIPRETLRSCFLGGKKKQRKKFSFWGSVFVYPCKVQLGRLCTRIVECYATVKIPQQTVMRMKYDMVLKEKLMTNSFARRFAAQVKKNQGGELYRKLGSGSLMKASGVLIGQLLYRFEKNHTTFSLRRKTNFYS